MVMGCRSPWAAVADPVPGQYAVLYMESSCQNWVVRKSSMLPCCVPLAGRSPGYKWLLHCARPTCCCSDHTSNSW